MLEAADPTSWRTFFLSLAALSGAFVLALYSSVSAMRGDVITTGVCASLALLLAGYVAVTAVPYLARRTKVEWLRLSMDYKLTREGMVFIGLIFLLAIAGLNTGNNLLFLILSSMLAAILVSGVLSLTVLTGVELEVLLPEHVFARRPVPARIHLRNDKKRIPSFSVTLTGAGSGMIQQQKRSRRGTIAGQALKLALAGVILALPVFLLLWRLISGFYPLRPRIVGTLVGLSFAFAFLIAFGGLALYNRSKWGKRSGEAAAGAAGSAPETPPGTPIDRRILRQPLYFAFLPGSGLISRSVELEFPSRGLYREEGFALSTRFPFGFLEKKLRLPVRHDLWVYPAVEPTDEFYEILPMLSGELEAFQKGRGHDLYSIRDMQASDSARHVDWKASARTRSLKVREYAREDERRLQLIFDTGIGTSPDGKPDPKRVALFEAAVEFCACLAWHFHEVDAQLQFRCGDFETPPARAGETIYAILRHLAEVKPSPDPPLASHAFATDENVFRIICTALPRGSVPTNLWSRSYFIFFDTLRPMFQRSEARTPAPAAMTRTARQTSR
jgi:uncharacterized protein (DUF58 family)